MQRFLLVANVLALLGLAAVEVTWAGFGGMPLMARATPPQTAATVSTSPSSSKIAVFNMAAIMKDYAKAKFQVYELNEEKRKLSVDLRQKQETCVKLKRDIESEQDKTRKEELQDQQKELSREIEDVERQMNKQLSEKASVVIRELYDEIKAEVDQIAEKNGYDIVFTYPDATTPEDFKSTYVKELKLKPPAAQPFFVAKHADLTETILQELNSKHPAPPVPQGMPLGIPQKPAIVPPLKPPSVE